MGIFDGVELDEVEVTGPRLRLRPWRTEDAAQVYAAMQDPDMHRFLPVPDPYTREDAEEFVTRIAVAPRRDGVGLECAVVDNASDRLVGAAAVRLTGDPEIGYWVAPAAQGNRYAAEACRALGDWAFRVGLPRVHIACAVGNVASARTAMAAGFRFEGISRDGLLGGGSQQVPTRRADLARFARLAGDSGDPIAPALPRLPSAGLSDGVIVVRVVGSGDAQALIEQETDPLTVAQGFTGAVPDHGDVARAAGRAGLEWIVGLGASFAIVDSSTGRFAGSVKLRPAGPPQIGGIGYAVHPRFRGRGYTARALRLIVPWAFENADLARLELGAKVGNVASQKAALAGGFEPDGVRARRMRTADGRFVDEVRFALVNPRYR